MDNYKYNFDEMRSIMLENLYKIRRKAAKFRDFCDNDEVLAMNEGRNSDIYAQESVKYDEIIGRIEGIIDILR